MQAQAAMEWELLSQKEYQACYSAPVEHRNRVQVTHHLLSQVHCSLATIKLLCRNSILGDKLTVNPPQKQHLLQHQSIAKCSCHGVVMCLILHTCLKRCNALHALVTESLVPSWYLPVVICHSGSILLFIESAIEHTLPCSSSSSSSGKWYNYIRLFCR